MKHLRFILAATILLLAFSLPAFAGDMQTTVTSQPPAPPAATVMGDMQTTVTATDNTTYEVTAADSLKEVALNLIQSVLSLF